jgi:hypothetical protein
MRWDVFANTQLKILDLSSCTGISISGRQTNSLVDLSLPFEGFAAAAKAFIRGSSLEVLHAEIGEVEVNQLLPRLEGLGVDKLRVVSPRAGEYEWQRSELSAMVELTDPVTVTTPASVTMTGWRELPNEWKPFLRVIDLSGLALEVLPDDATLENLVWLERAVLPTGSRKLPECFFRGCLRLSSIDTSHTALEEIEREACCACRSLAAFVFPPTVRSLQSGAFRGTSITTLDLSGTVAEHVCVYDMVSLVDLVLPRRCVLEDVSGVPSLRCVAFGASGHASSFAWHPAEVRFESLLADAEFSPGLLEARLYGEVACELGCEALPFPPP